MTVETLIPVAYLIAAVTFILGLKGLSSPTTAVQGNRIAAGGMLIALIATFFAADVKGGVPLILAGIAVGGIAGFAGARMVKMTAMPQMVALFNGAGGGAAAVVAILEFARQRYRRVVRGRADALDRGHHAPRSGLRRGPGDADRRRGHAGRDLAAERVYRARGRDGRVHAEQPAAHRRRHARRRIRNDPHPTH